MHLSEQDLAATVQAVLAGEQAAFEKLYSETVSGVYRTLYFLCQSESDVEDIAQTVYLELYRNLDKYDLSKSLHSWLYGITIRQIQGHKRKQWREQRKLQKEQQMHLSTASSVEDTVIVQLSMEQDDEAVFQKMNGLPDKLKQVLVLRYINELSQQEVAEVLNIPVGTVKSRLNQALLRMRKSIRREYDAQ
ncbi:sigma-70 family RNA polymerase sigma factor [Paenibacillaceae bacterium]|nr:sigma-70 family RNA polymerase sigma factor [Paenibacillaceae bacterium]